MSRIRILNPQVAAKIAAGEVITRPAAAVKELVENALDAGALTITVAVEEGGRRLIRVVDDGSGMTPEDMPLSLSRHATSKLAAEADLLSITTLGFRGEALPSIAAVSRLTLTSCPPGAAGGFRVVAQAGEILSASPWAAAAGTQVEVAELFFNTPVRQKFLKSEAAETGPDPGVSPPPGPGLPPGPLFPEHPDPDLADGPGRPEPSGTRGRGLYPGTRGPYASPGLVPGGLAGDGPCHHA